MKIKTFLLNLILVLGIQSVLQAQNNDHVNDTQAINQLLLRLFDGMREGDSAKVASVFDPEVKMFTSYTDQQGIGKVKKGDLAPFLVAIGTPHDQIWDEKIWDTKIIVEGGIAQVWTNYAFYVGAEFSHCGIDAFHLIKDETKGWQIVHLMDTRKKDNCQTDD